MNSSNNVKISESGSRPIVFVHGYGCDQEMWRFIAPSLSADYRSVLYDLTGCGNSDLSAYDFNAYGDLARHAEDLLAICANNGLQGAILVGHSVGATIAAIAAEREPERFSHLIMVSPSPCFINYEDYTGGFDIKELEGVLEFMEENYIGWAAALTPTIAGDGESGAAATELNARFCANDPKIAKHFGRVTFLADSRDVFRRVNVPALIIQCDDDALAPVAVGEWLHKNMKNARLTIIEATGHCPHMTEPEKVLACIQDYLNDALAS